MEDAELTFQPNKNKNKLTTKIVSPDVNTSQSIRGFEKVVNRMKNFQNEKKLKEQKDDDQYRGANYAKLRASYKSKGLANFIINHTKPTKTMQAKAREKYQSRSPSNQNRQKSSENRNDDKSEAYGIEINYPIEYQSRNFSGQGDTSKSVELNIGKLRNKNGKLYLSKQVSKD